MASHLTQGQLIIQDENFNIYHKSTILCLYCVLIIDTYLGNKSLWQMEQPRVLNQLARKVARGLEFVKPSMTLQTSHLFIMKHHQRKRIYLRRSLILQRKCSCMTIRSALKHSKKQWSLVSLTQFFLDMILFLMLKNLSVNEPRLTLIAPVATQNQWSYPCLSFLIG